MSEVNGNFSPTWDLNPGLLDRQTRIFDHCAEPRGEFSDPSKNLFLSQNILNSCFPILWRGQPHWPPNIRPMFTLWDDKFSLCRPTPIFKRDNLFGIPNWKSFVIRNFPFFCCWMFTVIDGNSRMLKWKKSLLEEPYDDKCFYNKRYRLIFDYKLIRKRPRNRQIDVTNDSIFDIWENKNENIYLAFFFSYYFSFSYHPPPTPHGSK